MKTKTSNLSEGEMLARILTLIETHIKAPPLQSKIHVYDNKTIMELLNIKDKYLKKLRDNGYIGYSRCGDKYWYSQSDVVLFLRRFYYKAFAITDDLPAV